MPRLTRQVISVAAAAMLAAIAVYGSYLPMRKAYLFRQALQNMGTIHTPAQFRERLSAPLDAPSPIGQGELVVETARLVLTLTMAEGAPPNVTAELVNFVNARFAPILQRGTGTGYARGLYHVGAINVIAYAKTKEQTYLAVATDLFSRGLEASPKHPEFLYGLFDVYRITGDTEQVKAIANRILTLWPDDQRTKVGLAEYLARPAAP